MDSEGAITSPIGLTTGSRFTEPAGFSSPPWWVTLRCLPPGLTSTSRPNPGIAKARRRVDLEPEWRFRRPVAVNVDGQDGIFVLESARHRIQVYDKAKEYEEAPINL